MRASRNLSPTHPPMDSTARASVPNPPGASAIHPPISQVFRDYAPFVWRTLRHLGVPEADVDDVCQDVFVCIHRKLAGFEGRSTLRTWIYGICIRTASDFRRRAHVRREHPVAEAPLRISEASQHKDCERAQARTVLAELLEQLDEDKRTVFVLYEIEGLPMKEVAEAMDCPLQTAYSRLHAARKLVIEGGRRALLEAAP